MILTRTRLSNIIDIAYMFVIGLIIIFFVSNYIYQAQEEQREVRQFIERQNITHVIIENQLTMIEQNEKILCLEDEILKQLDSTKYRFADTSAELITSCL